MEKYDVVAMGELLIDFTQNGYSEQGNPIFEANPGGAPCNVLAMLQKLGRKTAIGGPVEPAAALYYNDAKPDKIFYQGLALLRLGRTDEAGQALGKISYLACPAEAGSHG